jgi:hypothetical protein
MTEGHSRSADEDKAKASAPAALVHEQGSYHILRKNVDLAFRLRRRNEDHKSWPFLSCVRAYGLICTSKRRTVREPDVA